MGTGITLQRWLKVTKVLREERSFSSKRQSRTSIILSATFCMEHSSRHTCAARVLHLCHTCAARVLHLCHACCRSEARASDDSVTSAPPECYTCVTPAAGRRRAQVTILSHLRRP
eukprot:1189639-Prorocentrum_minimum.AAC.4